MKTKFNKSRQAALSCIIFIMLLTFFRILKKESIKTFFGTSTKIKDLLTTAKTRLGTDGVYQLSFSGCDEMYLG